MTSTHPGRTALFLAPPAGDTDEAPEAAPRLGEEAMRRLRNPFRTADSGSGDAGHAAAEQ